MHPGLHLVSNKEDSTSASLEIAPTPDALSLSMRADGDSELLVEVGDRIFLGQLLARSGARRAHSPVSGIVTDAKATDSAVMLNIANDGLDTPHPDLMPIRDYRQLTPEQLLSRIADAGIVGLGGAAFPTSIKLSAAARQGTRLLIVNCVECEPYISCDDALLRAHPDEAILGTQMLLHASGATEAIVAIEADKPASIQSVSTALSTADDIRISLRVIPTLYPAGGERQLIQTLTGREVPSGGVPPDIDVLCHNLSTAIAVARLATSGQPLTSRVVTIAGSGVRTPKNLQVRFGTPIAAVIAHCGGYSNDSVRLLMGGTMMGVTLPDDSVVISAASNCIVAATSVDAASRAEEMPCIRCGDCAASCPAALLPQQLLRYSRLNDSAALNELGLQDCIECGCCDYVCPSKIPLTSIFRSAKSSLLWDRNA